MTDTTRRAQLKAEALIENARSRYDGAAAEYAKARLDLYARAREAIAAGVPVTRVAQLSGLSRQMIHRITRGPSTDK